MNIVAGEVFPLQLPMRGLFQTSRGTIGGGAIKRNVVLIKLTDESGRTGWGEGSPSHIWSSETLETVVSTLRKYLLPAVIGRAAGDMAGLHEAMNRVIAPAFSNAHPIAKCAVDTAAHDLWAKERGIRVADLWGYRRAEQAVLSWTVASSTLSEVEASVDEGRRNGYSHFNLKLAVDTEHDAEKCKLIRKLAPQGFLWGDANGGYFPHQIHRICHELEAAGLDLLEQPLPSNRLVDLRRLKQRLTIPLGVDEPIQSPGDLIEWIRQEGITAHIAKPTRTGGLFPSRICMEIAEHAMIPTYCSGLTETGVGLAANLHLACAFGIQAPCAWNGPQFLEDDVLENPFIVKDGILKLPDGPGLGVQVDERKLTKYRVLI